MSFNSTEEKPAIYSPGYSGHSLETYLNMQYITDNTEAALCLASNDLEKEIILEKAKQRLIGLGILNDTSIAGFVDNYRNWINPLTTQSPLTNSKESKMPHLFELYNELANTGDIITRDGQNTEDPLPPVPLEDLS